MDENTRIIVAGLREGINFPKWKYDKDKPFVDLTGCKDIILVDRKYFLDHKETITRLASSLKRTLGKEDSLRSYLFFAMCTLMGNMVSKF